jgi:outer membrane protein assembly factor BamB
LWLLDRDNFGGDDHRTPLDRTPLICNDESNYQAQGSWGGMAAWQDARGAQWVVMPFYGPVSKAFHAPIEYGRPENGGVAAFRVEEQSGKWKLVPAWLSRDMDMADEPLVANGVVFTFGSGEDTTQRYVDRAWDEKTPAPNRIANGTHATVFALDAATGKELWSSGSQIASWIHNGGLSVANGHIYIGTFDGEIYCFGLK